MTTASNLVEVDRRLAEAADLVVVALDTLLPRADGPESRLGEAMRYAVLGPGVRLHPFFVIETAALLEANERAALRAASALECVRIAAQVQQDLPQLDDRSTRDGRPTAHQAYDVGTALLAADGLHAAAMEILSHRDTHDDGALRAELVRRLAVAAGARGLVGGRMIARIGGGGDLGAVARMQRMRTGALLGFAVEVGLCLARTEGAERTALMGFAQDFSLAQEIDEALRTIGKSTGERTEKGALEAAQLIAILGEDEARARRAMLAEQCRSHLEAFGPRARYLRDSVDFVLERRA